MRDPDRIGPTIKRLEKLWKEYPDLRLGQLILNVFSLHNGVDAKVYYMEDEEFIRTLEEKYENIK